MAILLSRLLRASTTFLAILALCNTNPCLAQPSMTISVTNHNMYSIEVSCVFETGQGELRTIEPGQQDQVILVPQLGSGGVCRGELINGCESVLYAEARGDGRVCSQKGISILVDDLGFKRKYPNMPLTWKPLQAECPYDDDY